MYQALYRKYRPATFDEVCGQKHVTSVLKYEAGHARLSHAYLFCGSRGTGKTSCAKILAKAVNCLNPQDGNPCNQCEACRAIDAGVATDVLEIDAASNNGVDNVRQIRDEVIYTPSSLKYRVYIIDEVHMLSTSAFNALLKTLEEPPSYVVFILATTEMHKLPATIISRCQRFEFRRIPSSVIAERLEYIAGKENIELDHDAALVIAKLAQGGMRDAVSLTELCAGSRERITQKLATEILGVSGRDSLHKLVCAIADKDYEAVFRQTDAVANSAQDISVFWQDLIGYYRDMLVTLTVKDAQNYLELTDTEFHQLREDAERFRAATLIGHSRLLEDANASMQRSGNGKRSVAELALLRMCDNTLSATPDSLLMRIEALESQLALLRAGVSLPGVTKGGTEQRDDTAKAATASAPLAAEPSIERIEVQPPAAAQKTAAGETPLSVWPDAVARLLKENPSLNGVLDHAAAVQCQDRVKIFADSFFAKQRLAEAAALIAAAISVVSGNPIAADHIAIEIRQSKPAADAMDDLF